MRASLSPDVLFLNMRSIISFVIVVAIALGIYSFLSKEEAPQKGPRNGGRSIEAPTNQRARVGKTNTPEERTITVNIPKGLEERLAAGVFSWRDTVSEDYLIRMEDAWGFDLGSVDFSKDILCTIDGIEITKDDLHAWMCLKFGQSMIVTKFFVGIGQLAAKETGIPYGLSDAQWEIYFSDWLSQRQMDRDYALALLSQQTRIPIDHVERVRRNMVESLLACFPEVESVDELPLGIGHYLTSEEEMKTAASMGALTEQYSTELSARTGRIKAPIAALLDPMSAVFSRAASVIRFRRNWTRQMHELPGGVLASTYLGEIDPDAVILPPWEYEGDRLDVTIDEIWSILEPTVGPDNLRSSLREVIWSKVLKAKLASASKLPSDRETWLQFADDFLAHQATLFNLDFVLDQRGYPSRSFFVNDMKITNGFMASQPEGWNGDENLRAFFEGNRFFTQGWEPNLELALFVPKDPSQGIDAPRDWDAALERAKAFKAAVDAGGDFSEMRKQHNSQLVEGIRAINQEMGDLFAQELRSGSFSDSVRMINQVLKQDIYRDHIDGVSAIRNAIIRLDKGQVGEPWKTPVGYVVIRMNGAKLARLEREYEDVLDFVVGEHASWALRVWVTETLSGLEFAVE